MNRRTFSKKLAIASISSAAGMYAFPVRAYATKHARASGIIRLGGPVYKDDYDSPDSWIEAIKSKGYTTVATPVDETAEDKLVQEYRSTAKANNIIIAEVGVWNNPIHPDEIKRNEAVENCIRKLDLAERIGARCCVNVSGSRGTEGIGGPNEKNLTQETFGMIVETTRKIIDTVKPSRTFFTLEMMPASYPDSVDSYLELIRAIDRKGFAVHFDPVNIINSPRKYYSNTAIIRDAFRRIGKYMKSCHAKDTIISSTLTIHLDECVPGTGNLDYRTYLTELAKLDNIPLLMEHMKRDEYPVAANYIRKTGRKLGLGF